MLGSGFHLMIARSLLSIPAACLLVALSPLTPRSRWWYAGVLVVAWCVSAQVHVQAGSSLKLDQKILDFD